MCFHAFVCVYNILPNGTSFTDRAYEVTFFLHVGGGNAFIDIPVH